MNLYSDCLNGDLRIVQALLNAGCDVNMINERGQTPIFAACLSGNKELVALIVEHNANINHQDNFGQTPFHIAFENDLFYIAKQLINTFHAKTDLRDFQNRSPYHIAVNRGHYSVAERLLDKFLNEDELSENHWLLLHAACYCGNKSTVEFLIDLGVQLNDVSDAGRTALSIACAEHHHAIIRVLLEHKADPNIKCKKGKTALQFALKASNIRVIELLVQGGADPSVQDEDGDSVLHLAVHSKNPDAVAMLVRHMPDLNLVNHKIKTSLHLAIENSNVPIIRILLEASANIDAQDYKNETPLYIACAKNRIDIVEELLKFNPSVNIHGPDGNTPLHISVMNNRQRMTRMLLDAGADGDAKEKKNLTPLHLAYKASFEVIQELLQSNVNVNAFDIDGDTPLHIMAAKGHLDKIILLHQHGANLHCLNNHRWEPFELAVHHNQLDVVQWFLENGTDPDFFLQSAETVLHFFCRKGTRRIVELLIKKNASVNRVGLRGNPIETAFDNGYIDIVRLLLSHGASVTERVGKRMTFLEKVYKARHTSQGMSLFEYIVENSAEATFTHDNDSGETLFLRACRDGALDIIKCLLKSQKEIGINAPNAQGQTPVFVLCQAQNVKLLSYLLNHVSGIDVDKADLQGTTPLHVACRNGSVFIVNLLLRKSVKSLNCRDYMKRAPLHLVKKVEVLELLMKWELDLEMEDYLGQSALLINCVGGRRDMVEALTGKLEINAINACDRMERRIVHLCVATKNLTILSDALFLDSPLDVDAKDINEQTGLHIAALHDDTEGVQCLIKHGADPNVRDKSGLTPLHFARSRVGEILRQHKATMDWVSNQGSTIDDMFAWQEQLTNHRTMNLWEELIKRGEAYLETIISMPLIGFIGRYEEQEKEFLRIKQELHKFMRKLSELVSEIDDLMVFELMPSGSMNETTKVGHPDEGDFVCLLRKVAELLDPPTVFTFQTTYVELKLKTDKMHLIKELGFVDTTGKVLTQRLFNRFYQAVALALANPELWKDFPHFYRVLADDIHGLHDKISNLTLFWHGEIYKWIEISVDIVPAVMFAGDPSWRPSWCEDREVLKTTKCCIVAKDIRHAPEEDRPYLFQFGFTDSDAAMFSIMIPELKEGYMLSKLIRQQHVCPVMLENDLIELGPVSKYISSYMLKTVAFYLHEEYLQNPEKFFFPEGATQTEKAVICARLILDRLLRAFDQGYLPMFFVRAFCIFRNHYENQHDQHVAKMYCQQLRNLIDKCPHPAKYGVHYRSNVDY